MSELESENMQCEENPEDNAGLLLEVIQNYEFLYDLKNKDYKNSKKKDDAWKEIASLINISADHYQKLWKSLRDRYTREKRDSGRSGAEAPEFRWALFRKMSFYEKFTKPRQTYTCTSKPSSVSSSRPTSACSSISSGRSLWSTLLSPEPQVQESEAVEGEENDTTTTLDREGSQDPGPSKIETQPPISETQTAMETPTTSAPKRKKKSTDEEVFQILEVGKSLIGSMENIQKNQIKPNDPNKTFAEYIYTVLNGMPDDKAKALRRRFLEILLEEDIN